MARTRIPTALVLLRAGTYAQAVLLAVPALAWVTLPVRELSSYRSHVAHDPTADLGFYLVPILLGLTAACLLAAAGYLALATTLTLSARRLPSSRAFVVLVALEAVAWSAPLLHTTLLGTGASAVLAGLLLVLGVAVVALAAPRSTRPRPVPSSGAASRVPAPHRAPRSPSARRH